MKRPRIEGYAVISREGMIATADGKFPEEIKIPADHEFYQRAVAAASAVANGRHSAEGGIGEKYRKRIILTRRARPPPLAPCGPRHRRGLNLPPARTSTFPSPS